MSTAPPAWAIIFRFPMVEYHITISYIAIIFGPIAYFISGLSTNIGYFKKCMPRLDGIAFVNAVAFFDTVAYTVKCYMLGPIALNRHWGGWSTNIDSTIRHGRALSFMWTICPGSVRRWRQFGERGQRMASGQAVHHEARRTSRPGAHMAVEPGRGAAAAVRPGRVLETVLPRASDDRLCVQPTGLANHGLAHVPGAAGVAITV